MVTMLDLPRELYLIVCSHLSTIELTRLAGVSRDHYLAVQQPLFTRIRLSSFGALVKLVGTLTKVPVVSNISAKQRLLWHRLSDSELRERDIRYLDVTLDCAQDGHRITGAVLSRLIGVISRKCDRVKIDITFLCTTAKLIRELHDVSLPNVTRLTLFMGFGPEDADEGDRVWTFAFARSTFPDLRRIYMNNLVDRPSGLPVNMEEGFRLAQRNRPRRRWHVEESGPLSRTGPFYGLEGMQEMRLEYNTFLDADILNSLFGSSIVPQNLTKLEIINCPALHPLRDLSALAILLQRGLQFLKFLKLHLTRHYDGHDGFESAYISKIGSHPKHHLCNVVRELGKKIKGLDLALPFACETIFAGAHKAKAKWERELDQIGELPLPDIPETPVNTLPQRLMAAGYRYRRIIFNMFCQGADKWEEMQDLARHSGGSQTDDGQVSWELLYDGEYKAAAWLVSGCAPVEFSVQGALLHPFDEG